MSAPCFIGSSESRVALLRCVAPRVGCSVAADVQPRPDPSGVSLIRGTSLSGYRRLVGDLGGDPDWLLRSVGLPVEAAGEYEAFVDYVGMLRAVELAAQVTGTPDFGRRLAAEQGIEILGAVGAAARSAPTVGEAFAVFERYLRAYSPAIAVRIVAGGDEAFFEFRITLERLAPHAQGIELALGLSLQIFRLLLGPHWAPVRVHLPHGALTPRNEYVRYFGAPAAFGEPAAGFTVRAADLARPLRGDRATHEALVGYLEGAAPAIGRGVTERVADVIRRLLPTGVLDVDLVAGHFGMHARTLQRRLAAEGTTFGALVDTVRRRVAEGYLRDTDMSLGHLASELGYGEQSALTRASHRWFGAGPRAHRRALRAGAAAGPGAPPVMREPAPGPGRRSGGSGAGPRDRAPVSGR